MIPLRSLAGALRSTLEEWLRIPWSDLRFTDVSTSQFLLLVLVAATALALAVRAMRARAQRHRGVALPALLASMLRSPFAATRHIPVLIFVAGIPIFAVALAGPYTSLRRDETSHPGRRIAVLVDASTSMIMQFDSARLRNRSGPVFFTAVAAAERFVRQRMNGPYRDLIALIEFGDQAYIVTPFTTDYENVVLSLRLIGEPREWGRFPAWGTTIIQGLEQGTALFESFDFLSASGNLMVIFTDGRDEEIRLKQQDLAQVTLEARQHRIPIYMIRTAQGMKLGGVRQDNIWKPAIERTGGRFYAASDDDSIVRALDEINALTPGRIDVKRYTADQPRYAGFALLAASLWLLAAGLRLLVPSFGTFQ